MKVFFNKKIVSNAFVVGGKRVPFEVIGDNQGVIALDDAEPTHKEMITGLEAAAREHRGGVLKVSVEEYDSLKKKLPYDPSVSESQRRKQMIGIVPALPKKQPKKEGASPVVASPKVQPQAQAYSEDSPEWKAAPKNTQGLRLDGPTRQEFIDAGHDLKNYPPRGYAERDTPASKDPAIVKHYKPKTQKLTK